MGGSKMIKGGPLEEDEEEDLQRLAAEEAEEQRREEQQREQEEEEREVREAGKNKLGQIILSRKFEIPSFHCS